MKKANIDAVRLNTKDTKLHKVPRSDFLGADRSAFLNPANLWFVALRVPWCLCVPSQRGRRHHEEGEYRRRQIEHEGHEVSQRATKGFFGGRAIRFSEPRKSLVCGPSCSL